MFEEALEQEIQQSEAQRDTYYSEIENFKILAKKQEKYLAFLRDIKNKLKECR